MSYIDGFVIAVPTGNKDAYVEMSKKTTAFFKKMGASRCVEAWGDDVRDGKVTDFRRAVAAEPGETVVLGWVEWPSKELRDKAGRAMSEDPEMKAMKPPFDGARMIFGGFETLHDSSDA